MLAIRQALTPCVEIHTQNHLIIEINFTFHIAANFTSLAISLMFGHVVKAMTRCYVTTFTFHNAQSQFVRVVTA